MPESLRVEDFSDREFLLVVIDVAEDDGWSDSEAVAHRLGFAERRSAAIRLSWLWRLEAVEREHARDEHGQLRWHKNGKPMTTQRWRPTELGEAIAFGKLRARQRQVLERFGDAELVEVTRWLSERTQDRSVAATRLALREWKYGH